MLEAFGRFIVFFLSRLVSRGRALVALSLARFVFFLFYFYILVRATRSREYEPLLCGENERRDNAMSHPLLRADWSNVKKCTNPDGHNTKVAAPLHLSVVVFQLLSGAPREKRRETVQLNIYLFVNFGIYPSPPNRYL